METITADNINAMRDTLPGDQAKEIEIGCRTWPITYGGSCRGQMTVWPTGRGAVEFGGDSIWGDWAEGEQRLYTEDYDEAGNCIVYDAAGMQFAV